MILYWTSSSRNLSDCTDRPVAHFGRGYSNVGGSESFAIPWYRLGAACLVLWYTWYYDISSLWISYRLQHNHSRILFSDYFPPIRHYHYVSSHSGSLCITLPITYPWVKHMEVFRTVQWYKQGRHVCHTVCSIHETAGLRNSVEFQFSVCTLYFSNIISSH